jgi:hypothetical protein
MAKGQWHQSHVTKQVALSLMCASSETDLLINPLLAQRYSVLLRLLFSVEQLAFDPLNLDDFSV